MTYIPGPDGALHESPVHVAFGLSYASYNVWPRVLMEAMPLDWQERLVALANEFNATWGNYEPDGGYVVLPGKRGTKDPLSNYRRPDRALIESLRIKKGNA